MQLDDFADRVLKPRISQLASSIDADVANAYKSIYQSVGTPGTTPATSLVLLQAQQKLNEAAAISSPRYATVNPAANAALVEGMKGLFNPVSTISKQFKSGLMGEGILGYEERPLVSIDYKTDPRSSIVDALSTLVINGTQVKIYAWYDNEWGYVNRTAELVRLVGSAAR